MHLFWTSQDWNAKKTFSGRKLILTQFTFQPRTGNQFHLTSCHSQGIICIPPRELGLTCHSFHAELITRKFLTRHKVPEPDSGHCYKAKVERVKEAPVLPQREKVPARRYVQDKGEDCCTHCRRFPYSQSPRLEKPHSNPNLKTLSDYATLLLYAIQLATWHYSTKARKMNALLVLYHI